MQSVYEECEGEATHILSTIPLKYMECAGVELYALLILNMAPYSTVVSDSMLVGLTSKTRPPLNYWRGDWIVPCALIFSVNYAFAQKSSYLCYLQIVGEIEESEKWLGS
jgi:hypothetical protein